MGHVIEYNRFATDDDGEVALFEICVGSTKDAWSRKEPLTSSLLFPASGNARLPKRSESVRMGKKVLEDD